MKLTKSALKKIIMEELEEMSHAGDMTAGNVPASLKEDKSKNILRSQLVGAISGKLFGLNSKLPVIESDIKLFNDAAAAGRAPEKEAPLQTLNSMKKTAQEIVADITNLINTMQ